MPPEESPEAKFDRLKKQLQDAILKGYPNPERKGCPDRAVLQELAERTLDEAIEGDPHWHHVTHCSDAIGSSSRSTRSFASKRRRDNFR